MRNRPQEKTCWSVIKNLIIGYLAIYSEVTGAPTNHMTPVRMLPREEKPYKTAFRTNGQDCLEANHGCTFTAARLGPPRSSQKVYSIFHYCEPEDVVELRSIPLQKQKEAGKFVLQTFCKGRGTGIKFHKEDNTVSTYEVEMEKDPIEAREGIRLPRVN